VRGEGDPTRENGVEKVISSLLQSPVCGLFSMEYTSPRQVNRIRKLLLFYTLLGLEQTQFAPAVNFSRLAQLGNSLPVSNVKETVSQDGYFLLLKV